MISDQLMQKYARLAVRVGVNVQRGQMMVLTASVDCAKFARMCVKEAYAAGAGEVQVNWTDEITQKMAYEYESTETMEQIMPWKIEQKQNCIDKNCCFLYLESATPGFLASIDSNKLQTVQLARERAFEKFEYYTMNNVGQWSIVAVPTVPWAKLVFPDLCTDDALDALWKAILASVRVREDNDPVAEWETHNRALNDHCKKLNDYNFKSLHFENSAGTFLDVQLIRDHIWKGGGDRAQNGALFNPNMPTEETFTMPYKYGVFGKVVATKPLNYQGKMIEDFWLEFYEGKVVDYGARVGKDSLRNLLEFDGGSSYLGEVALISYHSPISQSGILFLHTLFDENASCHLALGAAYPDNVLGGTKMTREQLEELGSNYSMEHCDFMFGSEDMSVVGITHSGHKIPVFEKGDFIL